MKNKDDLIKELECERKYLDE